MYNGTLLNETHMQAKLRGSLVLTLVVVLALALTATPTLTPTLTLTLTQALTPTLTLTLALGLAFDMAGYGGSSPALSEWSRSSTSSCLVRGRVTVALRDGQQHLFVPASRERPS